MDPLASAAGLGGRKRMFPPGAERARASVAKAVKSAVDEPELGRDLVKTVRTGTICAYEAESVVAFRT